MRDSEAGGQRGGQSHLPPSPSPSLSPSLFVVVYCSTRGCPNDGIEINRIEFPPADAAGGGIDRFIDCFGQGAEEEADYCPRCGQLGEATEA